MKTSIRKTPNDVVARILDSDDELPDSYEETSEMPAFMNDHRFDDIELPWLNNCKPVHITKEPQQITSQEKPAHDCIEERIVENDEDKSRILISQGILTTRDLFFIKSIEEYCSESTLLWFIDSLKNKALPNRFHKSCLAKDISHDDYKNDVELFDNKANYYFQMIVL